MIKRILRMLPVIVLIFAFCATARALSVQSEPDLNDGQPCAVEKRTIVQQEARIRELERHIRELEEKLAQIQNMSGGGEYRPT